MEAGRLVRPLSHPTSCREEVIMSELVQWYADLDPTFAFLVMLPFVVAVVALCADWLRTPSRRRPAAKRDRRRSAATLAPVKG